MADKASFDPFGFENEEFRIVRESGFIELYDKKEDIRIYLNEDTDLSQLWSAVNSGLDTSQFFTENADGEAELQSQYNGVTGPSSNPVSLPSGADFGGGDANNVGALEADQLSNGLAGSGNTITSVDGNSGEYRALAAFSCGQSEFSTTATSYSKLKTSFISVQISDYGPLTNWDDLYASVSGTIREDVGGETATFRLFDERDGVAYNQTEDTVDGANSAQWFSEKVPLNSGSRSNRLELTIQAKTTGGTAILDNNFKGTFIQLWGKIA